VVDQEALAVRSHRETREVERTERSRLLGHSKQHPRGTNLEFGCTQNWNRDQSILKIRKENLSS